MSEIEDRLARPAAGSSWDRVRGNLLASAESEGLLDVTYEVHETPFGEMIVAASREGIVRIALPAEDAGQVLDSLAARVSPRLAMLGRNSITRAREQLDSYFGGNLREFELPLDWRLTGGFRRSVLEQTAAIPYGVTASCGEIAGRAGSPGASRAAGSALANNPLPIVVPCHRVLRSDGKIGAYLGGTEMKRALLELEGRR